MKIVIIVPNINNAGGVARVLATRVNYMVDKWGYTVHIITQNKGNTPLFYNFSSKVIFHDVTFKGGLFHLFFSYRKHLKLILNTIQPNKVIVADNGLKAFLFPYLFSTKNNWILEIHSSLFYNEKERLPQFLQNTLRFIKKHGTKKYTHLVLETQGGKTEWSNPSAKVISNPLWFIPNKKAALTSKKMVAAGRHVNVKGFDRLLIIWKKVIAKHPDWILEIYGDPSYEVNLHQLIFDLDLQKQVVLKPATSQITKVFLESSGYLMTSHYEGFGMVLLEAMACGLPLVAYNCPVGPKALIADSINGFLVENNNEALFVEAVLALIESQLLREKMGVKGYEKAKDYTLDKVMEDWQKLLNQ